MRSAMIRLPGHPDAACDMVAESIVDEYVRRDPESRLRLAVHGGRGALFVSGDVSSSADFDVSAHVRRTLGRLGVLGDMEPFISLEPVDPTCLQAFRMGGQEPVIVSGYATSETASRMPEPVDLAQRIAKALEEKRISDSAWFWMGPDGHVMVSAAGARVDRTYVTVEHGTHALENVRSMVDALVHEIAPDVSVHVNALGPNEARGLAHVMGASNRGCAPYGDSVPIAFAPTGVDFHHPSKGGAWLCRSVARKLLARGAKAILVQATYVPGAFYPFAVRVRDEKGQNMSDRISKEEFSLERIAGEWWRPDLHMDAQRFGFAGSSALPWEG